MMTELNVDGPHSDEYTVEVARAAAEAVRVLNHATLNARGINHPSTAYSVAESLSTAVYGMLQLLEQLSGFLQTAHSQDRLGLDGGGDVFPTLRDAVKDLAEAEKMAGALTQVLAGAASALSAIHTADPVTRPSGK